MMTLVRMIQSLVAKVTGLAPRIELDKLKKKDELRRKRMADLHKKVHHLYYRHTPYEPYDDEED